MVTSVRVDSKGRLTIPQGIRDELNIKPGDTFFFKIDGNLLQYAKADNPFDKLVEHAIKEREAGRVKTLQELARERNINLEDD